MLMSRTGMEAVGWPEDLEVEPAEGPKIGCGVGEKVGPPIGWHCHFLSRLR